jgi:hypothetical protein
MVSLLFYFRVLLFSVFGACFFSTLTSCGGSKKLKPTEEVRETKRILRKKTKSYRKDAAKKRKNKRKHGYYGGKKGG